ncbi:hypothetical protein WJX81_001803 [Elliptochloris bilobata]|uniref:Uncharacterized protein n=1 Tax=Elliptochloris bilobata TaxID=381761 RepID=A0AAW1QJF1_9CHLO
MQASAGGAGGTNAAQPAANIERLVASLQAKVGDLKADMAEEFQKAADEAAAVALAQARHDEEQEQRLALVEGNARSARHALAALSERQADAASALAALNDRVAALDARVAAPGTARNEAGAGALTAKGPPAAAALGHLQDNALFEPSGSGGAAALATSALAEALAEQGRQGDALRSLMDAVDELNARIEGDRLAALEVGTPLFTPVPTPCFLWLYQAL